MSVKDLYFVFDEESSGVEMCSTIRRLLEFLKWDSPNRDKECYITCKVRLKEIEKDLEKMTELLYLMVGFREEQPSHRYFAKKQTQRLLLIGSFNDYLSGTYIFEEEMEKQEQQYLNQLINTLKMDFDLLYRNPTIENFHHTIYLKHLFKDETIDLERKLNYAAHWVDTYEPLFISSNREKWESYLKEHEQTVYDNIQAMHDKGVPTSIINQLLILGCGSLKDYKENEEKYNKILIGEEELLENETSYVGHLMHHVTTKYDLKLMIPFTTELYNIIVDANINNIYDFKELLHEQEMTEDIELYLDIVEEYEKRIQL